MSEEKTDYLEEVKEYLVDPYYLAFLAILGVATFLRFKYAFFQGMWVDEGRYAALGFEISQHILDYSTPEVWKGQITQYPPVYSYLIAFSTYIFGKTDFAVRIVSPLVSIGGIVFAFYMGREMENREVGLITAALLAINPIFWFLSERILIGATFATVYTAAIFCLYYGLEGREYSRYAIWALGPLVALNVMTKQPAYTLGLIIPIYFIYKKREEIIEFWEQKNSFRQTSFYQDTLKNMDYYISGGLGLLVITPWILRNQAVCGFPLCGLQRAAKFATKGGNAAISSVQETFYFINTLPSVVTLPIAVLLGFRVLQYVLARLDEDPDYLVKYSAFLLVSLGLVYFFRYKLLPMMILTSIALLPRKDSEKLLWLTAGIGIGFMSIPTVKVPRYIVFTIPSLLVIGSITFYSISKWISRNLEEYDFVTPARVAIVALIPVLFLSYTAGLQNVKMGGFSQLEPAGEWIDQNTPENKPIVASSPAVMKYYVFPRMAYKFPKNETLFKQFIQEKDVRYVEVDVYERAQPKWAQTSIPPYRIPNSVKMKVRRGEITPKQALTILEKPPNYLVPVKRFGKTRIPFTKKKQPVVTVYRVNRTALKQ